MLQQILEAPMKLALIALTFALNLNAFAAAPSLKDSMKAIGGAYKAIKATVADRGQNAANAANADQIATLFTAVLAQVPDAINELPAPQQPAAKADYLRLINSELSFAK